jgi:hypothetical protein
MPTSDTTFPAGGASVRPRATSVALLCLVTVLAGCGGAGERASQGGLTPEQLAIQESWGERGVWINPNLGFSGFVNEAEYIDPKNPERYPPPFTPEARAFREKVRKTLFEEGRALFNPTAACMPVGVPYLLAHPTAFEIQFSRGRAMMLYENREYRIIYTDGRGHPDMDEFEPGFYGHSIGHWEGNTFVIETVGLRGGDKMQVEPHVPFTSAMRVTERWTPDGPDRINVEVTMDDPGIFTEPWVRTVTMVRERDNELVESICVENNRNPVDASGSPMMLDSSGKPLH